MANAASSFGAKELAKTRAHPRCKFFLCLTLLDRWAFASKPVTGEWSVRAQAEESIHHLLLNCVFSREVWFIVLRWSGSHQLSPSLGDQWPEWCLTQRKRVHCDRRGFDSLVALVSWLLWKQRSGTLVFLTMFVWTSTRCRPSSEMRPLVGSWQGLAGQSIRAACRPGRVVPG
jgi:hypothetical protein